MCTYKSIFVGEYKIYGTTDITMQDVGFRGSEFVESFDDGLLVWEKIL